jgi:hypothetical protein
LAIQGQRGAFCHILVIAGQAHPGVDTEIRFRHPSISGGESPLWVDAPSCTLQGEDLVTQTASVQHAAMNEPAHQAAPSATHARPARAFLLGPVGLVSLVAVVFGWSTRDEYYVVPEEGLGYALGIVGLAMMLLLLLYSLRKHWSVLRNAGPIQRWFHIHMALGILGPTAILYHSNFHFGSLNANVALFCMLTVSLSGVVGRFIYTRIHFQYMGRLATLDELLSEARFEGGMLAVAVMLVPEMGVTLADFRERCLGPAGGVGSRVRRFFTLGHRARVTRRRALRAYRRSPASKRDGSPSVAETRRAVGENVRAVRRAGKYGAYERAFALWHALHLPFCVGLFLAAAVHVVAVHMY